MNNIPYIKITAKDNYDLGFKLGKRLHGNIKDRITANKRLYKKMGAKSFSKLIEMSLKFLPAVEENFPHFLSEVKGLSSGSKVKFEDLMVLICEEEVLGLKIPKCTNVAVKNSNEVLIGHNEDWLHAYKNNGLYILNCRIKNRHSLSLNYMGTLAGSSCGLNDSGLCFTANSLSPTRFRYGVPIKFQFRAILDCKTVKQAIYSDIKESSICGNTIYGWRNSRILDVEDHFGHHDFFQSEKFLIHTNHPLQKEDRNRINTKKESIDRYNRALEILNQVKKYDLPLLKKILVDHEAGICSHREKNTFWGSTIASVIMNPKKKWMEVCWSNPCKNEYLRHYL